MLKYTLPEMNEKKVYYPETIEQNPLPVTQEPQGNLETSSKSKVSGNIVYSPEISSQNGLPANIIARNTISSSINTQSRRILGNFQFGVLGAIQIGKYVNGTSGDIKLSPNGITGRNSAGITTFTIDGTTGDATFLGTIYATAGTIGGFTIASGYLYAGSGANTAGMSPADYPFWAGNTYANRATAPFRITPAGVLTLSGTSSSISIGSGNSIFKADSNGIYLGNATFASAPFSVSPTGAIITTDILVNVSSESGGGTGADYKYGNASRVLINGSGVLVRNTRGYFMEETTGGNYGSLTIGSDNIMVLKASETTDSIYIEGHDGTVFCSFYPAYGAGHVVDLNPSGGGSLFRLWNKADPDPSVTGSPYGLLYYNTTSNRVRVWNGAWADL